MSQEYIMCSAIHFDDGKAYVHQPKNIKTGFVVCGRRHHNCYTTVAILHEDKMGMTFTNTQGFLTDQNRFVDRFEAMEVAKKAGQVGSDETGALISEDIWSTN